MESSMSQPATQAEQNLMLLQRLIPRSEKLYIWCYRKDGELIATSCPEEDTLVLAAAFSRLGGHARMLRHAHDIRTRAPLLLGSPVGLQWALTYEEERGQDLFFVIGPVFYTPQTEAQVRNSLKDLPFSAENNRWVRDFCALLPRVSVLSYIVFIRYVTMIHNTLTGQQLGVEEILSTSVPEDHMPSKEDISHDRVKVYQSEKALLDMVRNGDISYQSAFHNSAQLSPGVPVRGQDPLRQMKTSIIVFTSLVCRAAMEGGLSPEIAYSLGDSYIQSVENSRDSGELGAIATAMYHDFIYRVHHLKSNPNYSPAIQKCCDYVELSLDRRIRTSDLAALAGYSEYYLTDKFKKETGQSLASFIREKKVGRAKVLLTTTDLSMQEISDRLAFSTVNFFIKSFRDTEGITPAQYRKREAARSH